MRKIHSKSGEVHYVLARHEVENLILEVSGQSYFETLMGFEAGGSREQIRNHVTEVITHFIGNRLGKPSQEELDRFETHSRLRQEQSG
jgi:hypothetical protein